MSDIKWTAREAMACALCWAEFYNPETTGIPSPETYWLSLPEKTRNSYRRTANQKLLLAVARGQAVPILPAAALTDVDEAVLGHEMRLQQPWRIRRMVEAVYRVFARRETPDA